MADGGDPTHPKPPIKFGAVVAHYVSLLVGYIALVYAARNQWFVADEWDWLIGRRVLSHGASVVDFASLFRAYNGHWTTFPNLIARGIFSIVGMRTYLPYVSALLLFHVGVAHLLWRIMRRGGADGWIATLLAAAFLVLQAGDENLLWAFQIGFVGAVFFGLLEVLLVENVANARWRRDLAGSVSGLVALMFAGPGLVFIPVVLVAVGLRRSWKAAMRIVAPQLIIFLVWYMAAGRQSGGAAPVSPVGVGRLAQYAMTGVSSALESPVRVPGAGAAIALALLLYMLMRRGVGRGRLVTVFSLAGGAIVLYLLAGLGRVSVLGVEQARASRYAYIAIALFLPAIGTALTELANRSLVRQLVVCGLILAIFAQSTVLFISDARATGETEQAIRRRLVAAMELHESDSRFVNDRPDIWATNAITISDVMSMSAQGALPETQTRPEDRLSAIAALQVAFVDSSPTAGADGPGPDLGAIDQLRAEFAGSANCIRLIPTGPEPSALLNFANPAGIGIEQPWSEEVVARVTPYSEEEPRSLPLERRQERDESLYLASLASDISVRLELPSSGGTTLCGLSPASDLQAGQQR